MNDEEMRDDDMYRISYPQTDEQKELWLYVFKMELERISNNTRPAQIEWAIEAADIALFEFNKRWNKDEAESQEQEE